MDKEWLARVGGVWVEASYSADSRLGVHPALGAPHPGEHRRQQGGCCTNGGALPDEARFVLGDTHYDDNELREACLKDERFLLSPKRGAYPHTDAGVEVRRIFHLLRHRTVKNFNEHFKAIFDVHGPVPTKGSTSTARFALGAVFVYQLGLLYPHERGLQQLNVGMKPFLRAA